MADYNSKVNRIVAGAIQTGVTFMDPTIPQLILPVSHKNYASVYSILVASAINKHNIDIHTDTIEALFAPDGIGEYKPGMEVIVYVVYNFS